MSSSKEPENKEAGTLRTRFWKIWKKEANNIFLFKGRIMIGSEYKYLLITFALINIPTLLLLIFVLNDMFSSQEILLFFGSLLMVLTNTFLITTVTTDPGIILKTLPLVDQPPEIAKIPLKTSLQTKCSNITIQSHFQKVKYCHTCNLYRSPRAVHCSICDVCVEVFDHHCPWLGTCIGKRNYRFFYLFVLTLTILDIFAIVTSIKEFVLRLQHMSNIQHIEMFGSVLGQTLKTNPFSVIIAIYCILAAIFIWGLFIYHTFLIATNQTTHEQLKKVWSKVSGNPYSRRNFFMNLWKLFKWNIRKSYIENMNSVTLRFGRARSASLRKESLHQSSSEIRDVKKHDDKEGVNQDQRNNEANNKSINSGEVQEKENDQLTDFEHTNKEQETKDLDIELQVSQEENQIFPKIDAASLFRKTTTRHSVPTTNTQRLIEDETKLSKSKTMRCNRSLTDRGTYVVSSKKKTYRHIASYN